MVSTCAPLQRMSVLLLLLRRQQLRLQRLRRLLLGIRLLSRLLPSWQRTLN